MSFSIKCAKSSTLHYMTVEQAGTGSDHGQAGLLTSLGGGKTDTILPRGVLPNTVSMLSVPFSVEQPKYAAVEGCMRSYEWRGFSNTKDVGDVEGHGISFATPLLLALDDTVELLPACVSIMPIVGESDRLSGYHGVSCSSPSIVLLCCWMMVVRWTPVPSP